MAHKMVSKQRSSCLTQCGVGYAFRHPARSMRPCHRASQAYNLATAIQAAIELIRLTLWCRRRPMESFNDRFDSRHSHRRRRRLSPIDYPACLPASTARPGHTVCYHVSVRDDMPATRINHYFAIFSLLYFIFISSFCVFSSAPCCKHSSFYLL